MSGPFASQNPYEPPNPLEELRIDAETRVDPEGQIRSVTFQVTLDDMRRAGPAEMSPLMLIGVVILLATVGMSLVVVPFLREHGLSSESLRAVAVSAIPIVALVCAVLWVRFRKWGRGSQESPFETTVILTPSALIIQEAGIAELRRAWSSIAGITHNRHRIRFDFLMFDPRTSRFVPHPGPIVPLRAFDSEADAIAFFTSAQLLIQSAAPRPLQT